MHGQHCGYNEQGDRNFAPGVTISALLSLMTLLHKRKGTRILDMVILSQFKQAV
jgi:hypothetical protein